MKTSLNRAVQDPWNPAPLRESHRNLCLEECEEQGIAGLLYYDCCRRGLAAAPQLRKIYLHNFATHKLCLAKLEQVVQALNQQGLEPLILRGPALVEQFYDGDGGLRRYSDIDLCVPSKDYAALATCLACLGFKRDLLYPHIWKLNGWALDCHQDPLNLTRNPCYDALFPGDLSEIFNRALPFSIGAARALIPNEVDQFSLLAIHLVKHSFSQQMWEIDLVRCVDRNFSSERLELLRGVSQRSCLLRFILYFLSLKYHCVPEQFFEPLPPLPFLCRRLAVCLAQQSLPGSGPLAIFLCLPPRLRWKYARSVLWPRANVRNQIATDLKVKQGRARFFVYRCAHSVKTAGRLIGHLLTRRHNVAKPQRDP